MVFDHEVQCLIQTTVVQVFSGDLIGCSIRSKWGPFGDLLLANRKYLFARNKLCELNKVFSDMNSYRKDFMDTIYGGKIFRNC